MYFRISLSNLGCVAVFWKLYKQIWKIAQHKVKGQLIGGLHVESWKGEKKSVHIPFWAGIDFKVVELVE